MEADTITATGDTGMGLSTVAATLHMGMILTTTTTIRVVMSGTIITLITHPATTTGTPADTGILTFSNDSNKPDPLLMSI